MHNVYHLFIYRSTAYFITVSCYAYVLDHATTVQHALIIFTMAAEQWVESSTVAHITITRMQPMYICQYCVLSNLDDVILSHTLHASMGSEYIIM